MTKTDPFRVPYAVIVLIESPISPGTAGKHTHPNQQPSLSLCVRTRNQWEW